MGNFLQSVSCTIHSKITDEALLRDFPEFILRGEGWWARELIRGNRLAFTSVLINDVIITRSGFISFFFFFLVCGLQLFCMAPILPMLQHAHPSEWRDYNACTAWDTSSRRQATPCYNKHPPAAGVSTHQSRLVYGLASHPEKKANKRHSTV